MSSTTSTYVLFRITYNYIVSRKKSLRKCHVPYNDLKSIFWKVTVRKVLRNWDTLLGRTCRSDFMGISWRKKNPNTILIMSPRHSKVENTMDFKIEMELHFYFKSHCDSRENTWFGSCIIWLHLSYHVWKTKESRYILYGFFNNS